jgi:hypothetical protein
MTEESTRKQETAKPEGLTLAAKSVLSQTKETLSFSAKQESAKIGVAFLAAGIIALSVSIFLNSQVTALVGLGTTFWGALFILMSPSRYVEGSLLANQATSFYLTMDRVIADFKYPAKAYYVPPYSRERELPDRLKGLKENVVFVSASKDTITPTIEDIAQSKFMSTNKKGVLIAPPGLGILFEIEKRTQREIDIGLSDLCIIIPRIMEELALTKEMTMHEETERVNLTIHDSLYRNLYIPEYNLKSISLLGCPIVAAIACAIAKTTRKIVTIQNLKVSPEDRITEIEYQILQG